MPAPKKYADRKPFPFHLSDDDKAKAQENADVKDEGNITAYLTRRIREDNAKLKGRLHPSPDKSSKIKKG